MKADRVNPGMVRVTMTDLEAYYVEKMLREFCHSRRVHAEAMRLAIRGGHQGRGVQGENDKTEAEGQYAASSGFSEAVAKLLDGTG